MLSRDSTGHELDVLDRIKRESVHPQAEGIAELLDAFVLVSREMVSYRCLVLEAMWQNGNFCKEFPPTSSCETYFLPALTRIELIKANGDYTQW
jgi:hypothetical protein